MNILLIGAGGQARVIIDILQYDKNINLIGIIDKQFEQNEKINGTHILGNFSDLTKIIKEYGIEGAVVGVGDNKLRAEYYNMLKKLKLKMINAIHPSANIATNVMMGDGNVICREAVICTNTKIGSNVIINTAAIVEHENIIGDHVHIGPGVKLAGRVIVDDLSFVGLGALVKDKIKIGRNVVVGVGSVVLKDIPDGITVVGIPAKRLIK